MSKIAFIGTGIMGAPMAGHLFAAGHEVTVWNRSAAKLAPLTAAGAHAAATPQAAAAAGDMLIVMVSDDDAADAVLFGGDDAAAAGLAAGKLVIMMSSIAPHTARRQARRLQKRNIAYIDAPVSGGEQGARDAALTIMVGGDAAAVRRASAVLKALGKVTVIGGIGAGQLAKLANQLIVGATIAAVAEALLLTERGGGDAAATRDALRGGFADSVVLRQHGARMLSGDFTPGGSAKHQLKDLRNVMAEAARQGAPLPQTATTTTLFAQMTATAGFADLDHSALYAHLKQQANGATGDIQ